MADNLFGDELVEEGDRLIVDIEQSFSDQRGIGTLEASRVEAYGNIPVASEETGDSVGAIAETDDGDLGLFEQRQRGLGQQLATINDGVRTNRRDLGPIDIGRNRINGRFTPDNTVPAPESPSDRDPDDGEFTTPDPRPITDIGRQQSDGLFDLF